MISLATGQVSLFPGDCVEVMAELDADSVDAIVCDPPYELNFMSRGWDNAGVAFDVNTWTAALRVLRPGGHLLAFGGTRTYHRMTSAIEDAGFEIRDSVMWIYGSGFPKSLDVSKAIDKAAGAQREVVGPNPHNHHESDGARPKEGRPTDIGRGTAKPTNLTAPATSEAQQWEGWGTALKPAHEPIVVARKPLIGTVAANVQQHCTGALNIDGCRVGDNPGYSYDADHNGTTFHGEQGQRIKQTAQKKGAATIESTKGRWPANIILDEFAGAELDRQSGVSKSQGGFTPGSTGTMGSREGRYGSAQGEISERTMTGFGDTGGASRFFYCAKAAKKERNLGLPEGEKNAHPTVKPVALMRYLTRLVTPPDGVVLDPFMGSGTEGIAAIQEGFRYIGIEKTPDYLPLAEARIRHALGDGVSSGVGADLNGVEL